MRSEFNEWNAYAGGMIASPSHGVGARVDDRRVARRHDPQQVSSFLDGDLRQVWALDRATGQPYYLEQGQAPVLRDRARSEWRCPVPGCSVEITTVGGDRRHHFRHLRLEDVPHASDGESEAHLAAKAMLAVWAAARLPPGTTVREEETVKDPATALHRIADVMVTWPNAAKTAFEVEYKPYTPEAWRQKQADYGTHRVPCVWLLGHTRVKPVPPPKGALVEWSNMVKVPALGAAFAAKGRHVLVINPDDQTDRDAGRRPRLHRTVKAVHRHCVARCRRHRRLPPRPGPRPGHPDNATHRRSHRGPQEGSAAPRRPGSEEGTRARGAGSEKDTRARLLDPDRGQQATGDRRERPSSMGRLLPEARAHALWGDDLPELLTYPSTDPEGIFALPVHWHTALYRHLIHGRPRGYTFTVTDCWCALKRERIQRSRITGKVYKALISYLEDLEGEGLVVLHRNGVGGVTSIETRWRTIDDLLLDQEEHW